MSAEPRSFTIVLAGGGTGGSVAPLLAVAEQLKALAPNARLMFIGSSAGPERALAASAGLPFTTIPSGKLRRYFSFQNFIDIAWIVAGFFFSLWKLRSGRVAVIVSAGSYVAVPVVWAGWVLGIPALIHQQDIRPGLANQLMSWFAKRITVNFPESLKAFRSGKCVVTGNPVRASILTGRREHAQKAFGLNPQLSLLVCSGGGTGAVELNRLMVAASQGLVEQAEIIHITGPGKRVGDWRHPHYHPVDFLTAALPDVFCAADIVISRAGLATSTELSALGKPVVFVPLPGTHQEDNARYFADHQAALIFPQANSPAALVDLLRELIASPSRRQALGHRLHQFWKPDAARRIAEEVLTLTHVR